MTDDLFYRKLESTTTIDLVDMIRDKDKRIAELEKSCDETQELLDKQIEATYKLDKENAELKDDNKVMADNYSKMEQKFYDNLTKAKELDSKYVIAHVLTEDLFKEDKSLLFDTKDEAKEYLIKHLICTLRNFWWICTVKDHNDLCLRWWGNGQIASSKMIDITKAIKEIKENDNSSCGKITKG